MLNETDTSKMFALLAPCATGVPDAFACVTTDSSLHAERLAALQRLRGNIYLEDGAIETWQLTEDGRHALEADERSWHLLSLENNEVVGCARLQVYSPSVPFEELSVSQSAMADSEEWGTPLRMAVTHELHRAEIEQLCFVEAGGWALAPELRCTTEALSIALGSYAVGEILGGSLGLSTATVRHHSSSILRRLGGASFEWDGVALPPYYDPAYRCEMEVVRFDSRLPNPKYESMVKRLRGQLSGVEVICKTAAVGTQSEIFVTAGYTVPAGW